MYDSIKYGLSAMLLNETNSFQHLPVHETNNQVEEFLKVLVDYCRCGYDITYATELMRESIRLQNSSLYQELQRNKIPLSDWVKALEERFRLEAELERRLVDKWKWGEDLTQKLLMRGPHYERNNKEIRSIKQPISK